MIPGNYKFKTVSLIVCLIVPDLMWSVGESKKLVDEESMIYFNHIYQLNVLYSSGSNLALQLVVASI